jgi:SPP1 family predicted phage head-tail adaptor
MPLKRLNPRAPVGLMNRWVTFYNPGMAFQSGPNVGQIGPPMAAFNTWTALFAVSGAELDRAQQIAQKSTHLCLIPYQLDVEPGMTIQYLDGSDDRVFQIEFVEDPDEQRWQLKIYCFEINQNAGGAG